VKRYQFCLGFGYRLLGRGRVGVDRGCEGKSCSQHSC
jgi:hypothetical protein